MSSLSLLDIYVDLHIVKYGQLKLILLMHVESRLM